MHTKRVVVWLRLVVVSPRQAGHRAARLVLLMLKAPGPGWPGPNAAPCAAPCAAPSPGAAWGWRWSARHSSAPAPRGAARVQFKRRPAARLRLVGPAGRHGGGFDPRRRRDHDLPAGRVGFGAGLPAGLPGLPTTRRHALSAMQFSAVVSCGPPLNTPPISSGTVPKEEPSHTLGDGSQGLPTGLQAPGGIDPSVNVLSTSAYCEPLTTTATDQQTSQWLQKHRFGAHLRTFNSFCGADLLRLTRDDLIQICGLADGIRLFNALHSKSLTPALTIYLTHASLVDDSKGSVFRALYLNSLNCGELSMRLAAHVGLSPNQIADIFIEGPGGIRVLITNEVVQHMKNEGLFAVELCQEHNTERFCLLLKPTTK